MVSSVGAAELGLSKTNTRHSSVRASTAVSNSSSARDSACSLGETLRNEPNGNDDLNRKSFDDLPPMDTGFAAWTFVAASFVLETLIWGFGFTYGIFQECFTREKTFMGASEAALGAIGTLALGLEQVLQLLGGGRILILYNHTDSFNHVVLFGNLLCQLGRSKFRDEGMCFGIGGVVSMLLSLFILPEWFSVRKGLAGAIIFGGAGIGGIFYPLALNYMLKGLGFRWTLRIWAAYMLVFGGVALIFMKPRVPPVRHPFLYSGSGLLPSLTLHVRLYDLLGPPTIDGTIVVVVFSAASVIGQVVLHPESGCLSTYLLWGYAHSLGLIFGFVIMFGILAGGFTSTWPAACADIAGPENPEVIPNVYGFLGIAKGVAAVIGPVVAATLHRTNGPVVREAYSGYGFRDVTIFVGVMMFVTALGGVLSGILSRRRGS
ncbi:Major Facilitator Superfamily [Rhizoctonia solani]|uniref:Major Facilitator Superfamily n=1 Tax=Rhizoctonia solani TaxID=456999 RepID=A0A8H7M327_9AGAM|nr:Major Facilitator Superfamily [Rhizoctonia solani]